jgi:hypothetical protein
MAIAPATSTRGWVTSSASFAPWNLLATMTHAASRAKPHASGRWAEAMAEAFAWAST